jgi:hypothetical protein
MDIDDILADIDQDSIPQETKDLRMLTRAWVTERVAPELQPHPEEIMERVTASISKQVSSIFSKEKSSYITKTSDRAHRGASRQHEPQNEFPTHRHAD